MRCFTFGEEIFKGVIHKNIAKYPDYEPQFGQPRGRSQMTSAERGREGGYPNTDAVRGVA